VAFFSLEMGQRQLIDRAVASVGGIDVGTFREGLSDKDRRIVRGALQAMRGKPIEVIDDVSVNVAEIRRRSRIIKRKYGSLGLVVVDYLQLMIPSKVSNSNSREQEVAAMSRGLKLLAKELCVPVLLLSQLNRKVEESRRTPMLSDLRESGAIEQDADIVIFLHQARSAVGNPDEPVQVIVAKGRSSGVGVEHLVFRRRIQRFEDSTMQEYQMAERESWTAANEQTDLL
jgi:replicative DNA helicase